jgi:hypothetical protein
MVLCNPIVCSRSQTRTFSASDGCGNSATASSTVTWTSDQTPPTFTGNYNDVTLGCNPTDINTSLGSASATDGCGTPTLSQSDGAVTSNGCLRSQVRTFTATDACGNTATITRTVNWTADQTPPVFTGTYTDVTLGCNPTDINTSLGSASATDGCGTPTLSQSDGAVTSNGCLRSQVRTFTATDACGNTATITRTVNWTSDVTPPVFTGTYNDVTLGCNPTDINTSLGSASATDGCGTPTLSQSDGAVTSNGCLRSQVRTFTATDACGNTATITRTVNWTSDQTPPSIIITGAITTLGCNPTSSAITAALGSATATDACGNPTLSFSDGTISTTSCSAS